jgi:hypothetical protein
MSIKRGPPGTRCKSFISREEKSAQTSQFKWCLLRPVSCLLQAMDLDIIEAFEAYLPKEHL